MGGKINIATVAALVFLAGCSGPANAPTGSSVPSPNDDASSVFGFVVDDEQRPVPGARATLGPRPLLTEVTDAEGRFTFHGVPVGTYRLVVSKEGYRNASRDVGVTSGGPVQVRVELAPVPAPGPRTETIPRSAYMQVGASTPFNTFRPTQNVNDDVDFSTELKPGAKAVVGILSWQSSAPLTAKKMRLDAVLDDIVRNQTTGSSPLRNVVDNADPRGGAAMDLAPPGTRLVHNLWLPLTCDANHLAGPTCTQDPPSGLAVVVYEQRFAFELTIFYDAPPV